MDALGPARWLGLPKNPRFPLCVLGLNHFIILFRSISQTKTAMFLGHIRCTSKGRGGAGRRRGSTAREFYLVVCMPQISRDSLDSKKMHLPAFSAYASNDRTIFFWFWGEWRRQRKMFFRQFDEELEGRGGRGGSDEGDGVLTETRKSFRYCGDEINVFFLTDCMVLWAPKTIQRVPV